MTTAAIVIAKKADIRRILAGLAGFQTSFGNWNVMICSSRSDSSQAEVYQDGDCRP